MAGYELPRRTVLRGLMGGGAVTVALPFLDCFLSGNGAALASGAPLPLRFGTWFWGLGHSPNRAITKAAGRDFEFLEECKVLTPYKAQINFFSGYNAPTDGRVNYPHSTGLGIIRSGGAPATQGDIPGPTLDVLISDAIGTATRFKSLEVSANGSRPSFSARDTSKRNSSEVSAVAFYNRIFGPEFIDPNKADFKPDPRVMARQSVLSAVREDSAAFMKKIGQADKARMDEYFTSIRQVEKQLELQMQKPPPADACAVAAAPGDLVPSTEVDAVIANHKVLTQLLAMAIACNQTKVFNMAYSDGASSTRMVGESATHHTLTHEEPVDEKLGYQAKTSYFVVRSMEALATFIEAFASIKEGDGTLLDNTLIFAHTDTSYAKIHALDGIPAMTVGKAGGRLKTGLHVIGNGDPISCLGLTMQQVMGLPTASWGTRSLQTSKVVKEVLA